MVTGYLHSCYQISVATMLMLIRWLFFFFCQPFCYFCYVFFCVVFFLLLYFWLPFWKFALSACYLSCSLSSHLSLSLFLCACVCNSIYMHTHACVCLCVSHSEMNWSALIVFLSPPPPASGSQFGRESEHRVSLS